MDTRILRSQNNMGGPPTVYVLRKPEQEYGMRCLESHRIGRCPDIARGVGRPIEAVLVLVLVFVVVV